jgi:hypothetical protein
MAARLVALGRLPTHVGHETISIFKVDSPYCGGLVISIAQIAAGRMYIEAR